MMRRLILAAVAVLAACQSPKDPSGGGPPVPLLRTLPRPLSSAEQAIVRGSNDFSLRLFREVNRTRGAETVVLSPFSVTAALGMAANGAAGGTFEAMRTTLGLGALDTAALRTGYRDLFALVRGLDPRVTTEVANSVWYSPGEVAPLPTFLQTSRDFFGAEVRQADFRNPATVGAINGWVSTATKGMIPSIIESTGDDVMALINAIYFKARWRWAFPPANTAPAPFTAQSGQVRQVPMMSTKMPLRLTRVAGATAAELLYGNGAYGLVVLLPDAAGGVGPAGDVNAMVAALTPAALDTLAAAFADTGAMELEVKLPRLDIAAPASLAPALTALGMGVAFSDRADFSRINGTGGLFISRVEHRARMRLDEEGTTAAAATYVGIAVTSLPPSLIVDRPFVLLLRERLSGTILFVAKVVDVP
jgi:serpin B